MKKLLIGLMLCYATLGADFTQEEANAIEQATDNHAILGVDEGADLSVIKKAYYKLSLKYHPDKNENQKDLATKIFKKIKDAFDLLQHQKTDFYKLREGDKNDQLASKVIEAIKKGKIQEVFQRVPEFAKFIDIKFGENNNTFLIAAVHEKSLEAVRVFLFNRARVSQGNKLGETPLSLAIEGNQVEIAKLLLQHQAAVAENASSKRFIASAIKKNDKELVTLLLQGGMGVDTLISPEDKSEMSFAPAGAVEADDVTLLMFATQEKNIDIVRILLEQGANPTIKIGERDALEIAESIGDSGLIALLKEAAKRWLFFEAASRGDLEKVKSSIEHGVDINIQDILGDTALMKAAENGHFEIVKFLLEKGADAKFLNKDHFAAFHKAKDNGFYDIALYIRSILTEALIKKIDDTTSSLGEVKSLIYAGASVNFQGAQGDTPLMKVIKQQRGDLVGAFDYVNPYLRNDNGHNLADVVNASNNLTIQQFFLEGSKILPWIQRNYMSRLAELITVIQQGGEQALKRTKEAIIFNEFSVDGYSHLNPLSQAVASSNLAIVQLLLEKGANPKKELHFYQSPLIQAQNKAKDENSRAIYTLLKKVSDGRDFVHLKGKVTIDEWQSAQTISGLSGLDFGDRVYIMLHDQVVLRGYVLKKSEIHLFVCYKEEVRSPSASEIVHLRKVGS